MMRKVTPLAPSYVHGVLLCQCDSPILMRDTAIGTETQSRRSMGMTMLWIWNNRENLSYDDETKSESLKENLIETTEGRWVEAERYKGDSSHSVICV
jgi:hypothetical protein